jgi:hypothetical protein
MLCRAYKDYGGANYAPMQNWPNNFIAMVPEDIEKDEVIGSVMDDLSSTGAVLWAVVTAWWLLDLQRRGESLVTREGKRWQTFVVIITRCLRSVAHYWVSTRATAIMEEAQREEVRKEAEVEAQKVDRTKRIPDTSDDEFQEELDNRISKSSSKLSSQAPVHKNARPAPKKRRRIATAGHKNNEALALVAPAASAASTPPTITTPSAPSTSLLPDLPLAANTKKSHGSKKKAGTIKIPAQPPCNTRSNAACLPATEPPAAQPLPSLRRSTHSTLPVPSASQPVAAPAGSSNAKSWQTKKKKDADIESEESG